MLLLEVFFIVMLSVEGVAGNIPMLVNSVALLIFGVLVWRGVPRSHWLLLALLAWRVADMGVAAASFDPGDHRLGGTLALAVVYVVVGLLVASPLGRARVRAAT